MTESDCKEPLLDTNTKSKRPKTYITRWYILCVVSLNICLQNWIWASWGPIAQSAKAVYGWSNTTIFMMPAVGSMGVFVVIIPAAWLVDVKGLRITLLLGSLLMTVGAGLRCITTEPSSATWLIFIGQTLNGVGGTVGSVVPPLLSETWFSPNERTTATGIGTLFSAIGGATSFLVGPYIVSEPISRSNSTNSSTGFELNNHNVTDLERSKIGKEILRLNYIEFGMTVLLLVMVIIYFPNKPPTPPSLTAGLDRMSFKDGLRMIGRMFSFWHISLAFGIAVGVYASWSGNLDILLSPLNFTQKQAGWIAFFCSIGGTAMGVILSRFADIFAKRMKLFLICIFSVASVSFIFFTLMCNGYIERNKVMFYVTCILGSSLVVGSMPFFFELACESAYPAAAGVITGCVNLSLNLLNSAVLLISLIPNIGVHWLNWAVISAVVTATVLVACFKAQYNRINIDMEVNIDTQKTKDN